MKSVHKLTEGAILLAIFAVLLLITIYIPVLGAFVNLFLAIPFIMFAAKNNRKGILIFLVAAVLISIIAGALLAIPLTLSYGMTGLVLGDFIREKRSRGTTFIAATITYLLNLIAQYVASVIFFQVNYIEEIFSTLKESIDQSKDMLSVLGQNPDNTVFEQFQTGIDMMQSLIPSLFVLFSIMAVFLIQLVSFPIVKRFKIEIPGWKPFRELTLPKSLLYYFLIALLITMFVKMEDTHYLSLAITNITFVLQFLMIFQGLSFIWYFCYTKSLPRAIPIVITVMSFLMPILLYIVWILGIIDLGFDLRKRVVK